MNLKMKDLFKIYNDLFQDSKKWKLYESFNINPFDSDESSKHFISRFIELSGKINENPLYKNIQRLDDKRIKHIVSTYFLGIFFYNENELLKKMIDKIINRFQKQNKKSKITFSFIWFLICLFHDLGYYIEENEHYVDFEEFIDGKIKYFLKRRTGVPIVYEKTFRNYFNYKLHTKEYAKPDHGIAGGIILFNVLNSILKNKQINNFSNGKNWNRKLINIYNFACWVILSHNIYFIRRGDSKEKEYIENQIKDLILEKDIRSLINLKKHTFLFLFLLVDTIDPIKLVNDYENLKYFKIGCVGNKIIIKMNEFILTKSYIEKINELKEWLIPNININENVIEIILS